ncbi:MAG: ATP synthase F1 subunit delta [Bacteroidales bacterium]|nr:ATP synthase F1 subunit delta [Bacteroidales bacterium]
MNQSKISVRYAKALFEFASERGVLDAIIADVKLLSKSLGEIAELAEVFQNPVVKPSNKKSFVSALLTGKVSKEMIDFLNLVISNNREIYIQDILRNVLDIYRKKAGITAVTITSAAPLSAEQQSSIVDLVKKGKNTEVELQTNVDSSLLGGFVLRIEDMQYDASIKTRLKQVKNELMTNK